MQQPPSVPAPPRFPVRRPDILQAAADHLRSGDWVRLEGVPEVEADLAAFHGPDGRGRAAIPWYIASGTASLEAIMLGHGIGPGDEVVTTPYTWGATVSAILAIGAIPVFSDIDPVSGLMDARTVEQAITPRTRAVLTVHLFGHPVDLDALRGICDRRGVLLFEDGSQAHGARWRGRRVGHVGDAAAFSCMGMKLLAGTEGGYALFRDPAAAEAAFLYGKHPRGLTPEQSARLGEAGLLDALQLGWRPCTVGATLVRAALPHLDGEIAARRRNAAHLRAAMAACRAVTIPPELPGAEGCYHLLSVVLADGVDRRRFMDRLQACGVGSFIYIPTPIHRLRRLVHQDYRGPRVLWHEQLARAGVDYRAVSLPGAERRALTTVEMGFNWTVEDAPAMQALAAALTFAAG